MRLVSFIRRGQRHPDDAASVVEHGVLTDNKINVLGSGPLRGLIPTVIRREVADQVRLADVRLVAPVDQSSKVFAVGLNFAEHRNESRVGDESPDQFPAIFMKPADCHVGHEEELQHPAISDQYDYEGELAIVIGAPCFRIPMQRVYDHIFGYSIYMDGSVRDWQFHSTQWLAGKAFPRASSLGPSIVSRDEVGDITQERLVTKVNGETRQDALLRDLLHDIPTVVSYVASFSPLSPGDIIAMGTPAGVGAAMRPTRFLVPGDVIEVEISTFGVLRNSVTA